VPIPAWQYVVTMSAYIALLYGFHELMRRKVRVSQVTFFAALFTFPLWIANLEGWFRWGKTLLVLLPINFLGVVRAAYLTRSERSAVLRQHWVDYVLYAVLIANILEASVMGLTLGHTLNGLAGLLLAFTQPRPGHAWRIDERADGSQDLLVDTPLAWCWLYTTWNAAFVYGENPGYLASSLCILTVPLLTCYVHGRSDLWVSARVYTLGLHITVRACYDVYTPLMDSSFWAHPQVLYGWGALNFVLHLAYLGWWWRTAEGAGTARSAT
jgi:hypothetical protein